MNTPGASFEIVAVGDALRERYFEYCAAFGALHDPSYVDAADIAATGADDAAFLVVDSGGRIRGAGALMREARFLETGKGRLRIFHVDSGWVDSQAGPYPEAQLRRLFFLGAGYGPAYNPIPCRTNDTPEQSSGIVHSGHAAYDGGDVVFLAYEALARILRGAAKEAGFRSIFFFLPETEVCASAIVAAERCGFRVERHSWEMRHDLHSSPGAAAPEGFRIERAAFPEGGPEFLRDAPWVADWCRIVNDAFAHLAGHTESTPERFAEGLRPELEYEGGRLFAFDESGPCGLVLGIRSPEAPEGREAEIGPIAVLPGFQRKGLGRALLRAAMREAAMAGFESCVLSVNAENEKATALYISEGFIPVEHYLCWSIPANE
ncbi:MAG: GNAT family N-acetyltransferase [Rectinema sp.]